MVRTVLAAVLGIGIIVLVATLEGTAALSVTACNTTDASTVYSPVTGIVIRAAPLLAPYGCGEDADQVYTYVPVLVDSTGRVVAAQQYACYADAFFVNLTSAADSSTPLAFTVYIYAWDMQAYAQQSTAITDAINAIGSDAISNAELLARFTSIPATWTTTCQAVQTTNIEQLALCQPLAPEGTGPIMPPDAGTADAAEADAEQATDASDASDGSDGSEATDALAPRQDGGHKADGGPEPDAGTGADGARQEAGGGAADGAVTD